MTRSVSSARKTAIDFAQAGAPSVRSSIFSTDFNNDRAFSVGPTENARSLLKSVEKIEDLTDGAPAWAKSIAVLRAEDTLRVIYLHEEVQSRAEVGSCFYVRPLLPELTKASVF